MTAPASLFSAVDYAALAAIVFRPDYPGNATARGVVEAPGGDPAARDMGKRYSHVAEKYLRECGLCYADLYTLCDYLDRAHDRATAVGKALGVPAAFMPSRAAGALRVLEYPPGAGSHVHTDFDLFTLNLWRDQPNQLVRYGIATDPHGNDLGKEVHVGELGELLGCGYATPHSVLPSTTPQASLVYFAIPDHAAVLPSGATVGAWLTARLARSRYEAGQS